MRNFQVLSSVLLAICLCGCGDDPTAKGADNNSTIASKMAPLVSIPLDFKGIVIGAPSTPYQVLEKLGVKCGIGADEMQVCNGSVTFAGEIGKLNLVISKAGIVERIQMELPSESFETVAMLLTKKFGQPIKTERTKVQNRMGATFEQVLHQWDGSNGVRITYAKYDEKLDISDLYFSTKNDRLLLERSEAESMMRRAVDM